MLLLEKRKADPGRGKWSVPGGVVELGESSEQTVIREVKEETNLIVEEPILLDVVNYIIVDEKRKVRVLWHSEIDAICKDLQDKNLWIEIHSETNLDYILATSELQTN